MSDIEVTAQEAENLIEWIRWRSAMEALSNGDLCRELLKTAPLMGRLSDLCEIVAERLSPGIIEKMDDKEPTPEEVGRAVHEIAKSATPPQASGDSP